MCQEGSLTSAASPHIGFNSLSVFAEKIPRFDPSNNIFTRNVLASGFGLELEGLWLIIDVIGF